MKHVRVTTVRTRVKRAPSSRITSVIHVSINTPGRTRSSSNNKDKSIGTSRQNVTRSVSVKRVNRIPTEADTSTKNNRFRTGKVIDQQSLGTVEDLIGQNHRLPKNKKRKCQCSRRCATVSLFSLLFLGILIAIILIVLWTKPQRTSSSKSAFLRWNTTGITLFGNTGIQGNASNEFNNPFGLLFNSFHDFYIVDRNNHRIQKCRMGGSNCTTIAGEANAVRGTNMSDLYGPTYMYIDSSNNLYIADSSNQRVQFWSYGASYGQTIAGFTGSSGTALTQFNLPYGIALDSNAVYVSDCNNNRVMKYTSGVLSGTIIAGGHGQGANTTQLNCPAGLCFDASTNR